MGDEVAAVRPFSWGAFIGGLALAVVVGLVLNFFVGLVALGTHNTIASVLIELIPGALLALIAFRWRRQGFWAGVLTGAGIVAIIGGLCGTTLSSGIGH